MSAMSTAMMPRPIESAPANAAYLPHLEAWRKALGWSRSELWERSGVWPVTIAHLERQQMPARFGMVGRLAEAMGIQNWDLVDHSPAQGRRPVPPTRVQLVIDAAGGLAFYCWRLSHIRERAGLSLDDLADRAGVPLEQLQAVERQQQPASPALVAQLAGVIGCTQEQLIRWW